MNDLCKWFMSGSSTQGSFDFKRILQSPFATCTATMWYKTQASNIVWDFHAFISPFLYSSSALHWSSNDFNYLIVSSRHWFHSPRETMFEFKTNNIKPLAPVIYVSITMAKDGFRIIPTLRPSSNNRFYANQTEFKKKGKSEEGLRKIHSLSFVTKLHGGSEILLESLCSMTVCNYHFLWLEAASVELSEFSSSFSVQY